MSFGNLMNRLRSLGGDDGGQVLPMVCVMMLGLVGLGALSLDVGHAVYTSRTLQATTDADALAVAVAMTKAGNTLTTIDGTNTAVGSGGLVASYSAVTGGMNARPTLPNVTVSGQLLCLSTLQAQGNGCVGNIPYNAVQVTQTMVLTTFFGGILGKRTLPMNAIATAATRGGSSRPSNIAVLMDTTLSMNETDTNCVVNGVTQTQMQCALNGLQILLQNINPCGVYQTSCNATGGVAVNSFDRVALFTFPNVTVQTAGIFTNCSGQPLPTNNTSYNNFYQAPWGELNGLYSGSSNTPWPYLPVGLPYSAPAPGAVYAGLSGSATAPTYQITNFLSDYRTSDAAPSLNPGSMLVMASGAVSGCMGLQPANWEADWGTYYAGALYAAQSALVTAQAANPGSENVLIILSDGDANALQYGNTYNTQSNGAPLNLGAAAPGANYLTASASGTYPSWVSECAQAVSAAQYAANAGTVVYSVGYGSASTGCSTDVAAGNGNGDGKDKNGNGDNGKDGNGNSGNGKGNNGNGNGGSGSAGAALTPCQVMAQMASAPQYFYSDYNQSGSFSTCTASQPYTSLSSIFKSIASNLSGARLIPNNTM